MKPSPKQKVRKVIKAWATKNSLANATNNFRVYLDGAADNRFVEITISYLQ